VKALSAHLSRWRAR